MMSISSSRQAGQAPADRSRWDLSASLYRQLRRLARAYMRGERRNHTLQPTALVHEAVLRLLESERATPRRRQELLALAAAQMRRVLVDHGRAYRAAKRGGGAVRVPLRESDAAGGEGLTDILALHEAMERMRRLSPRQERVFELHFFAGLGFREIGEALDICERTARSDWRYARTWLARELVAGARGRSEKA